MFLCCRLSFHVSCCMCSCSLGNIVIRILAPVVNYKDQHRQQLVTVAFLQWQQLTMRFLFLGCFTTFLSHPGTVVFGSAGSKPRSSTSWYTAIQGYVGKLLETWELLDRCRTCHVIFSFHFLCVTFHVGFHVMLGTFHVMSLGHDLYHFSFFISVHPSPTLKSWATVTTTPSLGRTIRHNLV